MAATSQKPELFNDYDGFVDKFKPKKTTDDCYTPDDIYEVVADYVSGRWGVPREDMVRPFWPGGDYEAQDYEGKVVVDNPPFSILSKICAFYVEKGVPFFLFAPALTSLSGTVSARLNHIYPDFNAVYENGAQVNTAFVTTFGDNVAETAPDLGRRLKEAQEARLKQGKPTLPKYEYPDHVLTAAMMVKYARRHRAVRAQGRVREGRRAGRAEGQEEGHIRKRLPAVGQRRRRASRRRSMGALRKGDGDSAGIE